MVIDNCTYKYASLEEGGSEETSLTINADGTSKAYLYYTRNKFTLTLSKMNMLQALQEMEVINGDKMF